MRGQREEARLLLREDLRDRLIAVLGMGPLMRNLIAPASKLGVQVVDTGERPCGKKRIAEVLNLAFDFALGKSCRVRLMRAVRNESFASPIRSTR